MTHPDPERITALMVAFGEGNAAGLSVGWGEAPEAPSPAYPYLVVIPLSPFLVEGVVEGAAGGALALALLYGLYRLVLPGFEFGLEFVLGAAPRFFSAPEALSMLAVGAGLGLLGSAAALSGGWRR